MRNNICEVVRRELDELTLDETCSTAAIEHLRKCSACREFHEKQSKLRQIVGSLGTVSAPADFDFRLRARLANESSNAASTLSFMEWPLVRRALAAVALLLVFAIGVYLVRNVSKRSTAPDEMAKEASAPAVRETAKPQEPVTRNTAETKKEDVAVIPNERPKKNRTENDGLVAMKSKQPLATRDLSGTGAVVIGNTGRVGTSTPFSIDASSLQYFNVSVDDGRGNAKTISVPTISFGSQRLMQNANQFAPKKVW